MVDEKQYLEAETSATENGLEAQSDEVETTVVEKSAQPRKARAVKKTAIKRKKTKKKKSKAKTRTVSAPAATQAKFPRHTLTRTLRIPAAILEQNAGRDCTDKEAMEYVGVTLNGERRMEISSAIKYGLLDRPSSGQLRVTDLARRILRPQQDGEDILARREAAVMAPDIGEVYQHYRGENLPDPQFFDNALVDTFHIPAANLSQFKNIFIEVLKDAGLIEQNGDKWRVIDVSSSSAPSTARTETFKKLERSVSVNANDSCFVIMPFAAPLGNHYSLIFEPAIEEAGLKPIRADNDIFATGKIMDQVWRGTK